MAEPAVPRAPALLTIEEYLDYNYPDWVAKAELVRGELRLMPTPELPHGAAASELTFLLSLHVRQHGLGSVFGDNIGYELVQLPRTVRVPDASFVRAERMPPEGVSGRLFHFPPDLAVEVISPSERGSRLEEKLFDYAAGGTPLVWLVDPEARTVTAISADAPTRVLTEADTLGGGTVVPGFSCRVADIFARIARAK